MENDYRNNNLAILKPGTEPVVDPVNTHESLLSRWPELKGELLPGEMLVKVVEPPIKCSNRLISSATALLQVTRSECLADMGANGPSFAASVSPENQDVEQLNLFGCLFGRDSLITARTLHPVYPRLQHATVGELATKLGIVRDPASEEEPGKVLHEHRHENDPHAIALQRERGWHWPHFGSVDASPLFISANAQCAHDRGSEFLEERFVGRDGQEHTQGEAITATTRWLVRKLKSNPEGFLEFKPSRPGQPLNQAWKDSDDSYFHKNGVLANHSRGIASIEVQALAYDALLDLRDLCADEKFAPHLKGLDVRPGELEALAEQLRASVMQCMWIEDGDRSGYFALGTDRASEGNVRPLKIMTSNMGHLLDSRFLERTDNETKRRRDLLIRALFSNEMLSENGIRTLSNHEVRYRSGSYHNGGVWVWDNNKISQGCIRHGFYYGSVVIDRLVGRIGSAEFGRGDGAEDILNKLYVVVSDPVLGHENTVIQPPQELQAWSAAAAYMMKRRAWQRWLHDRQQLHPLRLPSHASDLHMQGLEAEIFTRAA